MPQKLGQHFLTNASILDRIARSACPKPVDVVVEIGPGRGALTEKLLTRAAKVIAIEVDPLLVEFLRTKFADEPRLEVIHADVLHVDLGRWGTAPIAGNLPYYITSPIIELAVLTKTSRAVFLMQKEVAERVVAKAGSREYGYLSVTTALFADASLLFEVKPGSFKPPPRVDSAVVLLEPRERDLGVADKDGLLRFVGECFRQKRKMLRGNLGGIYGKEVVEAWPEATLRAEQVTLEGFAAMFRRL